MKKLFATETEKSFFELFYKNNITIEKIKSENSPDFLINNNYIFEIKEIKPSGTLQKHGLVNIQKINVTNVINKYLIDANKKINTYNKLKKIPHLYAVVIYNLRYPRWNHIIDAFDKCKLIKYPEINNLIYAGYNEPSNQTLALHVFKNPANNISITKKTFKNIPLKIY